MQRPPEIVRARVQHGDELSSALSGAVCAGENVGESSARVSDDVRRVLNALAGSGAVLLTDVTCTRTRNAIVSLALDGLVEVFLSGGYRSGLSTLRFLDGIRMPSLFDTDELSARALSCVSAMGHLSDSAIEHRIYAFNTRPLCGALLNVETAETLGLGQRLLFPESWIEERGSDPLLKRWHIWRAKDAPSGQPLHKIYVSAKWEWLRTTGSRLLRLLDQLGVSHMKLPRASRELLRPDHCVLYFHDASRRDGAVDALASLGNPAPQGVPFAHPSGLAHVFFGNDPPAPFGQQALIESCRRRIARIAATAIKAFSEEPIHGVSASSYALLRLELEGIDLSTWQQQAQCEDVKCPCRS